MQRGPVRTCGKMSWALRELPGTEELMDYEARVKAMEDPGSQKPTTALDMAALVGAFPWNKTPLGPRDRWPLSLRTAVRTMLACRLPMYLAWGPQFVQIYNDAYRPILGNKHPALGESAPETWSEIWPTIAPMWARVWQGESIGFDDFHLTINRFGYPEDCWFNFSYSPLPDDNGAVAGVLVTFAETTERVRTNQELLVERRKLQLALDAAEMGWWHYDRASDHASWDDRFKRIFGMTVDESPNSVAMDRILPEDRDMVWKAVEASLDPERRERFSVEYRIRHPERGVRWIEAHGITTFEAEAESAPGTTLVGTVRDITERKQAQADLRESEASSRIAAERLGLALRASRMGDWRWDAATDVVTLSERAAEIFGIPPGPHMTWTAMRELLHEDDRERARTAVEKAIAERNDYDVEYRIHAGDELRWVLARGRATYADGGEVTGMLGVVQDISHRKALEETLRGRSETLEVLNRAGTVIAGELDVHKVVEHVTEAATRLATAEFGAFFYNVLDDQGGSYMLYSLAGVDRSHFEGFPMPRATAMFGPTFRGEGVIRLADVRKDPRYGRNDIYHGMPPGHLPVVSYLAVPVISRSGEVLGGLFFGHSRPGVFTEAHQQAVSGLAAQAAVAIDNSRLYERVRQSAEAAEAASRMKDEFLSTVSHELRTPLTAIVGWVHLMRSGKLPPHEQVRALDTIDRNVKAQQQIIEDILDVSRIVAGKLRIDLYPVEVVAAVEGAIDALQPVMDSRQIRLQRAFDSVVMVLGDANRLQQVVWNLLANAVKYTPRGGRILVSVRRADSHVELSVSDNGEGISASFLPHVFERFRQADSSTTRSHGGIGLGLAIVRHLVELHGGTVEARSEGPGKGAQFIVRLPIAPATGRRADHGSDTGPERGSAASPASPATLNVSGLTVLVVDDEHDTRVLLATVLSEAGARVVTAASAGEALARIALQKPDVIVSDIGMPKEDGLAFLRRLRSLPAEEGGTIPAAALTAYARSEDRLQCLSAGFQTHVPKPVNPAELVAVIASLAGRTGR